MKRKIISNFFIILFSLLAISLIDACSDSENFSYGNDEHSEITMFAQMAKSFDSSSTRKKADTICVGDSMIFIATVLPSKSIRIQNSYWEMDGSFFASEFSVRDAITLSGKHDFVFHLIDIFGDTIRDTVNLWVAEPPILKTTNFIPASGSQGLPPNKEIHFVWQAYDPDSLLNLHYQFTLSSILDKQKQEANIIDTILTEPYFICNRQLAPLTIYQWTVQAFNEYGQPSAKKIIGEFSTKGVNEEAGVIGTLSTSVLNLYANIDIIVLDTNNRATGYSTTMEKAPNASLFSISPLPPGSYKITAQYKKGSDYLADTLPIKLLPGEVAQLDTLHLTDVIPPTIATLLGPDTINFMDTLSFLITDGDGTNTMPNTTIYFGDRKITSYREIGNAIYFATTEEDKSWFMQVVSIKAKDASGNIAKKDFYVQPANQWIATNNDTTISRQDSIEVFVKDLNPYGFTPSYYIINAFGTSKVAVNIIPETDKKQVHFTFKGSSFERSIQVITVSIIYENGFVQSRSWTLTINNPPQMSPSKCITKDITAISEIQLIWHSANDRENDNLLYRLGYTYTENETDPSKFIYPREFTKDTVIDITDLQEGTIYWWVQAKDPYGGTSDFWEQKCVAYIQDTEKNRQKNSALMEAENEK